MCKRLKELKELHARTARRLADRDAPQAERDMVHADMFISWVANRLGDKNMCTVRAVSIACDVPYLTTMHLLEKAGRVMGDGMKRTQYLPVVEKLVGWAEGEWEKRIVYRPEINGRKVTGKSVRKYCAKGRWIVSVKGHAFAVVDGVCTDPAIRTRKHILTAIKVGE